MTRRPILMHRFPDPVLQQLPAEQRAKAQRVLDALEDERRKGVYRDAIQEVLHSYYGRQVDAHTLEAMERDIRLKLAQTMDVHPMDIERVVQVRAQKHALDPNRIDVQVQVRDTCFDGYIEQPPKLDF